MKGQVEHNNYKKPENQNEYIGFKCLNYPVTENDGVAKVSVVKKAMNLIITFGIRTFQDVAKSESLMSQSQHDKIQECRLRRNPNLHNTAKATCQQTTCSQVGI